VVLLEKRGGADGEVRVGPVADDRRGAGAEDRHERDADQEQSDPHRPRDVGDADPGAGRPLRPARPLRRARPAHGHDGEDGVQHEHGGEVRLERDARVAQQRQLDPARARADGEDPQQLVAAQVRRQPEPHEPEAGETEEEERRTADPGDLVHGGDALHPRRVRDAQRAEGGEEEDDRGREAPRAGARGAVAFAQAAPRPRAWWTRWMNTGLPRR
jgi:hypothetical protein